MIVALFLCAVRQEAFTQTSQPEFRRLFLTLPKPRRTEDFQNDLLTVRRILTRAILTIKTSLIEPETGTVNTARARHANLNLTSTQPLKFAPQIPPLTRGAAQQDRQLNNRFSTPPMTHQRTPGREGHRTNVLWPNSQPRSPLHEREVSMCAIRQHHRLTRPMQGNNRLKPH